MKMEEKNGLIGNQIVSLCFYIEVENDNFRHTYAKYLTTN